MITWWTTWRGDNIALAADSFGLADRIMDVIDQLGVFKNCAGCRFMKTTGMQKPGARERISCLRRMKPAGPDDGCNLWMRRV